MIDRQDEYGYTSLHYDLKGISIDTSCKNARNEEW